MGYIGWRFRTIPAVSLGILPICITREFGYSESAPGRRTKLVKHFSVSLLEEWNISAVTLCDCMRLLLEFICSSKQEINSDPTPCKSYDGNNHRRSFLPRDKVLFLRIPLPYIWNALWPYRDHYLTKFLHSRLPWLLLLIWKVIALQFFTTKLRLNIHSLNFTSVILQFFQTSDSANYSTFPR